MSKRARKAFVRSAIALSTIIALGSLGTGLWILISLASTTFSYLTEMDTPRTPAGMQQVYNAFVFSDYHIAIATLIGSGIVFYIPIAAMNHFGQINKNKCLLGGAASFGFLGFGGQLATGILAYISYSEMPQQLQNYLLYSLNTSFDGLPNSTISVSTAWYDVMQYYECCGYYGLSDFQTNYSTLAAYWHNLGPYYYKNGVTKNSAVVPPSCCVYDSGDGRDMEQMLDANCPRLPNPSIAFYSGCAGSIINQVTLYQTVLMIVGFACAAITIIIISAPIYYIRHMPKKAKPKRPPRRTGKFTNTSYGRGAK